MARMKIHAGRLCWKVMLECVAPHHIWTFVAVVAAACCGCVYCYSLKSSKILVGRCWPGILCAWRSGPRQYHCHCGCGGGRYCCSFSCLLILCCRLLRFSSSRLQFMPYHCINLSFQKSVSKRGAFWYRLLVCCRVASACMRPLLGSMLGPPEDMFDPNTSLARVWSGLRKTCKENTF